MPWAIADHAKKAQDDSRDNPRLGFGMRVMRILVALTLCVPLAGCFSLAGPKAVPEWAMSPQAYDQAEPRAERKRRTAHRPARTVHSADRIGGISDSETVTQPAGLPRGTNTGPALSSSSGPTAYSPEWLAREHDADERLKRRMNICRGC